jgi:SAM-dependent methyltransferase
VISFTTLLKQKRLSKVLDFGCGTGRHTVYLANLGFDVYGLDWSEVSVNIARKELSEKGLHAELRVWDMNETPLPNDDSFFEGILVVRVFHHTFTNKIRQIASGIQRITTGGGCIYVEVPSWFMFSGVL